jgi:hypothetical protein
MQELEYTEAGSNCWKNRQAAGTTVIIYHENTKEIHAIWRGKNGGKVHYSKKIDLRNTSKKEATIACID